MPTTTLERSKQRGGITVLKQYDVAADAKKRISLRGSTAKYFHVRAFSIGVYMLEPRVLVPPHAISARSLKMMGSSAANLKRGLASALIDLTPSEDQKHGAYQRIKLSKLPAAKPKSGEKS